MAVAADRAIELAPRPGRPSLRPVLVGPRTIGRRSARARRMPFALFSALLVAALVLLLTSTQALVAQGAFSLSALSERAEELAVETDLLRLELAEMSSPGHVIDAAREAGLVRAQRVEVLPAP